jgi:hypothetical protein
MDLGDWLTKETLKKGLSQIQKSYTDGTFGFTRLDLKGFNIKSLEGDICSYKALQYIDMSHNAITDLSPIQQLEQLLAINFTSNALTDLGDFTNTQNLQIADFTSNNISSLASLKMPHTKALIVSKNKITDLVGLELLEKTPALEVLVMSWNLVLSTLGIQGLGNLKILDLRGNKLNSLMGMEGLKKLEQLDLRDNQLPALASLAPLSDLSQLRFLATTGNTGIHGEDGAVMETLIPELVLLLPQITKWNDIAITPEHRAAAKELGDARAAELAAKQAEEAEAAAAAAAAAAAEGDAEE